MALDLPGVKSLFPHSREAEEGFGTDELKAKTKEFYSWEFKVLIGGFQADATLQIPKDFTELVSAEWIVKAEDNETDIRLTLLTSYGQIGEDFENHQGSNSSTFSFTSGILTEVSITDILTSLTPGDIVHMSFVDIEDIIAHQFLVYGVRLKYR